MPFYRDEEGREHLENYDCDICHVPNALRHSCYRVKIGGINKAVCGKCYRRNRKGWIDKEK